MGREQLHRDQTHPSPLCRLPGIASAKDGGGHVSPLTCGSHHHPASVPMHISQHGAEYRRRPPSLDLSPKVLPGTLRLMGRKINNRRGGGMEGMNDMWIRTHSLLFHSWAGRSHKEAKAPELGVARMGSPTGWPFSQGLPVYSQRRLPNPLADKWRSGCITRQ